MSFCASYLSVSSQCIHISSPHCVYLCLSNFLCLMSLCELVCIFLISSFLSQWLCLSQCIRHGNCLKMPKINCETFRGHSHMAITHLSCFNCEHSCWLLLLWAGSSTECSHPFVLLCHVLTEKKHMNILNVLIASPCLSLRLSAMAKISVTTAMPINRNKSGCP